jgi:y4mF family transcriptional regulator
LKKLIYALKCPFTGDVHYIGKSTQGMIRPKQHMVESHSIKVNEWIENLKELGHSPTIEILENISLSENLDEREKYWINKYIQKDALLLNSNLISPVFINTKLEDLLENTFIHPTKRIGAFLKVRRKILNLTQKDMAERAGVGLRFVRELEQGHKTTLNIDKIQQVLNLFGCTLDVIKINK